jgi:hypothetical protein
MDNQTMMNVIAYQEGDVWIAQGIEVDIVARANTLDALQSAFARAVERTILVSQHLHGSPFAGIGKAPDKFRAMFDQAHLRLVPISQSEFSKNANSVDLRLATAD